MEIKWIHSLVYFLDFLQLPLGHQLVLPPATYKHLEVWIIKITEHKDS